MAKGTRLRIAVVVGDKGCTADLLLVIRGLTERGHSVDVSCDAKGLGQTVLQEAHIEYATQAPDPQQYDVPLCGTSATATTLQMKATAAFQKTGKKVVWFEDFPGTAHALKDELVQPDVLLVTFPGAEALARSVRPTLEDVRVVGKPSFLERVGKLNQFEERRRHMRGKWGLTNFTMLWITGGESVARAETQARAMVEFGSEAEVLAARVHPKLESAERVTRILDHARCLRPSVEEANLDDLIAVSDTVVCDWGNTDQFFASIAGVPVILTGFPDDRERMRRRCIDGHIPPLIHAGYGHLVLSHEHLLGSLMEQRALSETYIGRTLREKLTDLRVRVGCHVCHSMLNPQSIDLICEAVESACT